MSSEVIKLEKLVSNDKPCVSEGKEKLYKRFVVTASLDSDKKEEMIIVCKNGSRVFAGGGIIKHCWIEISSKIPDNKQPLFIVYFRSKEMEEGYYDMTSVFSPYVVDDEITCYTLVILDNRLFSTYLVATLVEKENCYEVINKDSIDNNIMYIIMFDRKPTESSMVVTTLQEVYQS
jgi:hypothetical protein